MEESLGKPQAVWNVCASKAGYIDRCIHFRYEVLAAKGEVRSSAMTKVTMDRKESVLLFPVQVGWL